MRQIKASVIASYAITDDWQLKDGVF